MPHKKQVDEKSAFWQEKLNPKHIFAISALHLYNLEGFLQMVLDNLPEHAPFYDKEDLTDRSQRFFVSEIIREKIFNNYQKEIPYSTEVVVTSPLKKKKNHQIRISAEIIVERDSQKNILIGKGGSMLKKVGYRSRRKDIEKLFWRSQKNCSWRPLLKVLSRDWRK
jgi:GTP-binding protein Era